MKITEHAALPLGNQKIKKEYQCDVYQGGHRCSNKSEHLTSGFYRLCDEHFKRWEEGFTLELPGGQTMTKIGTGKKTGVSGI